MTSPLPTYLLNHRKRWGLTQLDLSRLSGIESQSRMARIEAGEIKPDFDTAVALSELLNVNITHLFPAASEEQRALVARRLENFIEEMRVQRQGVDGDIRIKQYERLLKRLSYQY